MAARIRVSPQWVSRRVVESEYPPLTALCLRLASLGSSQKLCKDVNDLGGRVYHLLCILFRSIPLPDYY